MAHEKYEIVAGPAKFDLMMGLFDGKIVVFKTDKGISFDVEVRSVRIFNDNGHDAWSIVGFYKPTHAQADHKKCDILFSSKDRKGRLTEVPEKSKEFTFEHLERLSDQELREKIGKEQCFGQSIKRTFDSYLQQLPIHDRLMLELYATHEMAQACLLSEFDHKFHLVRTKEKKVGFREVLESELARL